MWGTVPGTEGEEKRCSALVERRSGFGNQPLKLSAPAMFPALTRDHSLPGRDPPGPLAGESDSRQEAAGPL